MKSIYISLQEIQPKSNPAIENLLLRFFFDVDGLKTLEVGDGNKSNVSVSRFLGFLIVVLLSLDADADTVRNALDSTSPDGRVQWGVESDILGAHGLWGEFTNDLDGLGSTLLECTVGNRSIVCGRRRVSEKTSDKSVFTNKWETNHPKMCLCIWIVYSREISDILEKRRFLRTLTFDDGSVTESRCRKLTQISFIFLLDHTKEVYWVD